MFRKRERFERTDVPKDNPYRNVIAGFVLLAVAVGVWIVGSYAWQRAQADSVLGDRKLSSALETQGEVEGYQTDGYTKSTDSFTNILVLTVDDTSAKAPNLQKAELLVLDTTANKGYLVALPLTLNISTTSNNSTSTATLADRFAASGTKGVVAGLASNAGISFNHMILANPDFWSQMQTLKAEGTAQLLSEAGSLLKTLRSDLDAEGLLELSKSARAIGISNLSTFDVPTYQTQDESGNTLTLIDGVSLAVQLGMLVQAS